MTNLTSPFLLVTKILHLQTHNHLALQEIGVRKRVKSDSGSHSTSRSEPPISRFKPPLPIRPFNTVVCNYCNQEGHLVSDCLKLKRKQQGQNESKPTGLIASSKSIPQFCENVHHILNDTEFPRDSSYGVEASSPPNPLWKLLNHSYIIVLYH